MNGTPGGLGGQRVIYIIAQIQRAFRIALSQNRIQSIRFGLLLGASSMVITVRKLFARRPLLERVREFLSRAPREKVQFAALGPSLD